MSRVPTYLTYRTHVICRDDLDFLPVLASLPSQQTVLEYLIGCWKRLNTAKSVLLRKVIAFLYSAVPPFHAEPLPR